MEQELVPPAEQTDEEAEMLEMSGFCPICSYKMSVHDPLSWAYSPWGPPTGLTLCPNFGATNKTLC